MIKPVKVDWEALYDKMCEEYNKSSEANWVTFVKKHYKITRPTVDRLRETWLIMSRMTLNKLRKKIDLDQFIIA